MAETPGAHDSSSTISFQEPSPRSSDSSSPLSASAPVPTEDTRSALLEGALARLTIEEEDQQGRMFVALRNIFQTALDRERIIDLSHYGPDGLWTLLQRADASSQLGYRDLEALRAITDVVDQMRWRGSQLLVAAAKTLADASRDGKSRSARVLIPSL